MIKNAKNGIKITVHINVTIGSLQKCDKNIDKNAYIIYNINTSKTLARGDMFTKLKAYEMQVMVEGDIQPQQAFGALFGEARSMGRKIYIQREK